MGLYEQETEDMIIHTSKIRSQKIVALRQSLPSLSFSLITNSEVSYPVLRTFRQLKWRGPLAEEMRYLPRRHQKTKAYQQLCKWVWKQILHPQSSLEMSAAQNRWHWLVTSWVIIGQKHLANHSQTLIPQKWYEVINTVLSCCFENNLLQSNRQEI